MYKEDLALTYNGWYAIKQRNQTKSPPFFLARKKN